MLGPCIVFSQSSRTDAKLSSSGIGRAVAVLMAREGADITIAHHPDEQSIAEDTKKMVEAENRTCFLFAGDLTNSENCRRIVDEHHRRYLFFAINPAIWFLLTCSTIVSAA